MMINPRFLFPEFISSKWRFAGKVAGDPLPTLCARCDCLTPKKNYTQNLSSISEIMVTTVVMPIRRFVAGQHGAKSSQVFIWAGPCQHCKAVAWTCDSFDWVSWMSDRDVIMTVINATPIRHVSFGSEAKPHGISIHDGTDIHFEQNGDIHKILDWKAP